jgi:hypothetical protein
MKFTSQLIAALTCALVAVAADNEPTKDTTSSEPTQQLAQNRRLVEVLVNGAVELAAENDPLKRADCCQRLAQEFKREILEAASQEDSRRVIELTEHFEALLRQGIAANLRLSRQGSLSGPVPAGARDLCRGVGQMSLSIEVLLENFKTSDHVERERLGELLQRIRSARQDIAQAAAYSPTGGP